MKVHHYDSVTGEYLESVDAQESPLEPGVFLVPAYATQQAPPAAIAGHVWCWRENAWNAVEDHRGERLWDASGAEVTVRGLGPLPEGLSASPPEPDPNAGLDAQILALEATVTQRRLREAALTEAGRAWLADLDAQIAALRAQRTPE